MTRSNRIYLSAALAAISLAALSFAAVKAADTGSPVHGHGLFVAKCASCHGGDLAGGEFGPPLKGATFEGQWKGQAPGALASFISARMPPS